LGRYLSLPFLLVAVILQSTVVPEIRISGGGPDLILMLVLSWTMLAGLEEGILWALVGGILQDIVNGLPTGTTALSLVIVAFVANLAVGPVGRNNLIFPPLVLVAGTVIYQLLLELLFTIFGRGVPIMMMLTNVTLPTVLFNVILILPVFRIMGFVFEASRPRRVTL
jgi:rod shape-determining protein MreD